MPETKTPLVEPPEDLEEEYDPYDLADEEINEPNPDEP